MRAIIADDSKIIRQRIAKMLSKAGIEVTEAANGKEALMLLTSTPSTELLLVDFNMPEMDGYELVCAVRENPAYDFMRLIMVTSETEMEQIKKIFEAGVNEYIIKPFTEEELFAKLDLLGMAVY